MLFEAGLFNLIDAFWKSDFVLTEVGLIFAYLCFAYILALGGVLCYL